MKQKVRRALAVSGMAIIIGTTGYSASANMATETNGPRWSHQQRFNKAKKVENRSLFHKRRLLVGVVSEKTDASFKITRGEKTFTVNITDDTRLMGKKWQQIDFTSIQNGHRVKVHGTLVDNTLTAKTIRNLSIQ